MAIDIQPPNYSGLVAIAGKSAPLNIQPTGALGLQALQQAQTNQASLRDDAARRMALQQQGQLGLLSNQVQNRALDLQDSQQQRQGLLAQANMNLDKQKLAMQGNQFDASLGMDQQKQNLSALTEKDNLDLNNRQLAEQTAKDQMVKLMADTKQNLQEKGAFASYGLISMSGAKSPEEAAQIKAAILEEAGQKKYMTPEEIKAAGSMSLSQFQNGLKYKVMQFGQVKEYKDMVAAGKPAAAGGTQTITLPDGTVINTIGDTAPTKTKAQADIMGAKDNLNELNNLYKNVTPDYFGTSALGQNSTYLRELGQSIPGLGSILEPSSDAKDSLKKYSALQGAQEMMSMNVIKQLSGVQYSDKQLEFMKKILPEFGPTSVKSVFDGRVENLQRFFGTIQKARQQTMEQGFVPSEKEDSPFAKQLLINMQSNVAPKGPTDAERQFYKQNGKTDAEIDAYFNGGK